MPSSRMPAYVIDNSYFDRYSKPSRIPEHSLLKALLLRSFMDLHLDPNCKEEFGSCCNQDPKYCKREARKWFRDDRFFPFSFLWTCQHLGISSAYFKNKLIRLELI
jgi:hypothetical protein